MNMPILFENEDMVAVHKPSGVMTHPDGRTEDETASDWFGSAYPESKDVGETQRLQDGTEITRPGVVHRLDRDTSGVLIFAKTAEAHEYLKTAFQERLVKKTYLAVTYGVPKERKGTIEFSIGRSRKDFRLRSAQPKAKGQLRDAITHYQVLADNGTHSLMKAMPETGRTHQIRVHFKAIHHPIVCDPLYAPGRPCDFGLGRLGLHAYSLLLPLVTGEEVVITAPLPEDFKKVVDQFPEGEALIASL
ncbi:RluA family pseudouridine synthase [Patescibacteria group bacterium]|nr:RluA family pseudouridine synthase [Patescibacteria group bacterium]MBU1754953.1 RluA family pseudouridine synthase [Patescibacteria group bacterium]